MGDLRTERLDLRPMSVDDLDAFADFVDDAEATRFLHTPEPRSRDEAAAGLARWATRLRRTSPASSG